MGCMNPANIKASRASTRWELFLPKAMARGKKSSTTMPVWFSVSYPPTLPQREGLLTVEIEGAAKRKEKKT